MFDGLIAFGHSIWSFCDPMSLGLVLLSSLVGVIIGALPGLTATMGVALMTTLTIKMPSNQALLVLVCTYVGAIYGGSRSAILLNIPGTPASAASCLDGYALAKQGLAGRAMGIATSGSVLGTLIGMFFLALFTPILGNLALKFGRLRILLARAFRRDRRGDADRQRSVEGLDRRISRHLHRGHRAGSDLRVRPLQLRQPRSRRRLPARPGARRRVRLRRAACGRAREGRRRSRSTRSIR
jgi:hypothetical protein